MDDFCSYFLDAFNYVIKNECKKDEVTFYKNDLGGITKYGISLRFLKSIPVERLKKYGIFIHDSVVEEDIINLTIDNAKNIYKGEFWDCASFEEINVDKVRNYIFDMAVNSGISPAIKCAQRASWSILGSRNLTDDGILGKDSLYTINRCGTYLLYALKSERAGFYRIIVEKNETQKDFIEEWLNRAYGD